MGLDFSHGGARWAYSGFNRFRTDLTRVAGLGALGEYVGFGGDKPWPPLKQDPVIALLDHSDCDGEIAPEHLPALADRLDELAPKLDEYDAVNARELARGCREAAEEGEPLGFC